MNDNAHIIYEESTEPIYIITVSGDGAPATRDSPAPDGPARARHNAPAGVTALSDGGVLVADRHGGVLRLILPDLSGVCTLFPTLSVSLPSCALPLGRGIIVLDTGHHQVKYVTHSGETRILAGSGVRGHSDGGAGSARFNSPAGAALGPAETVLYIADTSNHCIRAIDLSSRIVTTLCGSPTDPGHVDAAGRRARFSAPAGLALGAGPSAGLLFVADTGNHCVRAVELRTGGVRTVVGGVRGFVDGENGRLSGCIDVTVTPDGGVLYIADSGNNAIRSYNLSTSQLRTVAGRANAGAQDGIATEAGFAHPSSVEVDADGVLWVADTRNNAVRVVGTERQLNRFVDCGVAVRAGRGLTGRVRIRSASVKTPLAEHTTAEFVAGLRCVGPDARNNPMALNDRRNGGLYTNAHGRPPPPPPAPPRRIPLNELLAPPPPSLPPAPALSPVTKESGFDVEGFIQLVRGSLPRDHSDTVLSHLITSYQGGLPPPLRRLALDRLLTCNPMYNDITSLDDFEQQLASTLTRSQAAVLVRATPVGGIDPPCVWEETTAVCPPRAGVRISLVVALVGGSGCVDVSVDGSRVAPQPGRHSCSFACEVGLGQHCIDVNGSKIVFDIQPGSVRSFSADTFYEQILRITHVKLIDIRQ